MYQECPTGVSVLFFQKIQFPEARKQFEQEKSFLTLEKQIGRELSVPSDAWQVELERFVLSPGPCRPKS